MSLFISKTGIAYHAREETGVLCNYNGKWHTCLFQTSENSYVRARTFAEFALFKSALKPRASQGRSPPGWMTPLLFLPAYGQVG